MLRVEVLFRVVLWTFLLAMLAACQKAPPKAEITSSSPALSTPAPSQAQQVKPSRLFVSAVKIGVSSEEDNLPTLLFNTLRKTQETAHAEWLDFYTFRHPEGITLGFSGNIGTPSLTTYTTVNNAFLKDPGDISGFSPLSSSIWKLGETLETVENESVIAFIVIDTQLSPDDVQKLSQGSWRLVEEHQEKLGFLCIVVPESQQTLIPIPEGLKRKVAFTSWQSREDQCLDRKL